MLCIQVGSTDTTTTRGVHTQWIYYLHTLLINPAGLESLPVSTTFG